MFVRQVEAAAEEGCYLNMPYWFSKAMAKLETEKFLSRKIEAGCIIPITGDKGALHINLTRSGELVLKNDGFRLTLALKDRLWGSILRVAPVAGMFPVSDKRDNQFVYKITHCEMDGQRIQSSAAQEAVLAELLSRILEFSHAQGRLDLPQTKAQRDFRQSNYAVRIDPNEDYATRCYGDGRGDDAYDAYNCDGYDEDPDVVIANRELNKMGIYL